MSENQIREAFTQALTINATHAQGQDAYQHAFDQLHADYECHTRRYTDLRTRIRQTHEKRQRIKQTHAYRTNHPELAYSDDAWNALIDHATIHTGGTIDIHFKDGTNQTI